jgi:pyruvate/2-oxoglutarate dehydrogenase complex dihydrolipoamide acyltransferase (E2) component
MATRVIMPQLGESVVEGTVTKWLRGEGEGIRELEPLVEINTDKVDTEVPSPASGTVLRVYVGEGQTVRAGTLLAMIGQPGEVILESGAPAEADHGAAKEKAAAAAPAAAAVLVAPPAKELRFISPVVAKLAAEHKLDLTRVRGTGEGGRITKKDVLAFIERPSAPGAAEVPAWERPGEGDLFRPTELQFGQAIVKEAARSPQAAPLVPGTLVPHTPMRRQIAEHMLRSVRTAPHVTTVMEADMSAVVAHRQANKALFEREGIALTFTAYFVAASANALRAHPMVNSTWSEEGVQLERQVNIGVAVSLGEEGLIVPVLRDAEQKSLRRLAADVNDLARRARGHQLTPDEVRGGTFTITNHGVSGSLFATPIISQPQSAILGVGAIQKRVVVVGDAIAIRPMAYLTLTFDHRLLDGASADGFLATIVATLEKGAF